MVDKKGQSGKRRDRPGVAESCRDGRSTEPNDVPALGERVVGWLSRWGVDLLLTAGSALVSAGAGWIYPPAGLIAAGGLLIAGGVLWAKGGGDS